MTQKDGCEINITYTKKKNKVFYLPKNFDQIPFFFKMNKEVKQIPKIQNIFQKLNLIWLFILKLILLNQIEIIKGKILLEEQISKQSTYSETVS